MSEHVQSQGNELQNKGMVGSEFSILWKLIVSPKQAFCEIPQSRPLILALLIPALISLGQFFRINNNILIVEYGLAKALVGYAVLLIVILPLVCLIIKGITRLFGKSISFWSAVNIYGMAQAPRIVTSIILLCSSKFELYIPRSTYLQLQIVGLLFVCYSLFLLIYGLYVIPGKAKQQ